MMNNSAKMALLLALLLAFTTGCPPKDEQAQPLTPLKPNISKPQAGPIAIDNVPPDAAVAVNETPSVVETPVPEGSGSETAVPQPAPSEPTVSPANPAANNPPAVPLATAIPHYEMPIWEPSVVMSQAHQSTCVVQVGDPFPPLEVQTLSGEPADTGELLTTAFTNGKRLAVVVIWNADVLYGHEQFTRLQEELLEPYEQAGVQVIAIHTGDASEEAKQLAGSFGDALPSLSDADGAAFAKLANDKLPRTYLIDAQGKILWLDLEYSRGTRRDLRNAVMYHLTKLVDAAE